MELVDIDLNGCGSFTDELCGFRVDRYNLEEPWAYIYATSNALLKVDQRGPDYAQFNPPSGTLLFKRERYQVYPSLFVWVKTMEDRAFSNFYRPVIGSFAPSDEPQEFSCRYTPECALYCVKQDHILCETELIVPETVPAIVMTCTITNTHDQPKELELFPVMRMHFAPCSLAPWDVPSLYQRIGYSNTANQVFDIELRSPAGIPEQRENALVVSNMESPDAVELRYDAFIGSGTFDNPEALYGKPLSIDASKHFKLGNYTMENMVNAEQGIIALCKKVRLESGEKISFSIVAGSADLDALCGFLNADVRENSVMVARQKTYRMTSTRQIHSPDKAFDRYVNEFLPLQLRWVSTLDRGWPTGMRGTRDSAQDATAIIPIIHQEIIDAHLDITTSVEI